MNSSYSNRRGGWLCRILNPRKSPNSPPAPLPPMASFAAKRQFWDFRSRKSVRLHRDGDLRCRQSPIPHGNPDFRDAAKRTSVREVRLSATANRDPGRPGRLAVPQVANPARNCRFRCPRKCKSRAGMAIDVAASRHSCAAGSTAGSAKAKMEQKALLPVLYVTGS